MKKNINNEKCLSICMHPYIITGKCAVFSFFLFFMCLPAFPAESFLQSRTNKIERSTDTYTFELGTQLIIFDRTNSFNELISDISHDAQLRSYSNFIFIFNQNKIGGSNLSFQESLFLQSNIGIGGEIRIKYQILKNSFISISPVIKTGISVYSAGLEFYENTTQSLYAGAEFSVMPGGNLTLYGFWTPVYNIKYSIKDGGLRTIEGEGWEAGIRIVLPSQAVNTIRLSKKIEINLQRIPFEFHINSITDRYSGAVINIRRFSIGYLL